MSEEHSGDAAPVDDSAATENISTPAQDESKGTGDELAETRALFDELQARNDGLSRKLGTIESQLKKLAKQQKQPSADEKPIVGQEPQQDAQAQSEIEKLRQELRRKDIISSLQNALVDVGAGDPKNQARYLADMFDSQIEVSDDAVTIDDAGNPVDIGSYVAAYVKTDRGAWMVPPKVASTKSLVGEDAAPKRRKVTIAELNRLSPEELANGSFDVQM